MTGLEKCSSFFKELVLRFKVPAEMHATQEGAVRIHISRALVDSPVLAEIAREAKRRGLRVKDGPYWMTLNG